jgi:hypothetical protein
LTDRRVAEDVNPDTMLASRSLRDGNSGGAETSARRRWIPTQTSRPLSPVVQVAFQPAPGVIGGRHDPRERRSARRGYLVFTSSGRATYSRRCHEYQRALADITTAERAMRADAEQDDVADVVSEPQTRTRRQS